MKPLLVDLETAWRGGQRSSAPAQRPSRSRPPTRTCRRENSALGERAQAAGIPVHHVSRGTLSLLAAQNIRQLLATRRFDTVHANEAHAVSAAWLAGAHKRRPFIISRRVGYPIGKSPPARARYQAASRIVANSRWVAEQAAASGAPREKIIVIYEGAEIPRLFTPQRRQAARARWNISPDTPLLGCVGVLLPDRDRNGSSARWLRLAKIFPMPSSSSPVTGPAALNLNNSRASSASPML